MAQKRLDRLVYVAINRAVTPKFDRWARRNHGISGKKLLAKVAAAEGGGTTQHPNISSANARGPFQFIPSTRAAYKQKYGLDAWRTNTEAAKAAIIHLMGTGIAGYNPGMPSYTNLVLGQDVDTTPLRTGKFGSGKVRSGAVGGSPGRASVQTTPGELPSGTGVAELLKALRTEQEPALQQTAPLQAPAFSASKALALPQGYQAPDSGGGPQPEKQSLSDLLKEVSAISGGTIDKSKVTVAPGLDPIRVGGGGPIGKDGIPRGKPAKGTKVFEGVRVAAWIHPYLVYGRKHGWKGKVNSGFRTFAEQQRIWNSGVRPAARPGTSNHEGSEYPRGAIDVSDAAGLNRILRRRGTKRLRFAGAKDPVHFSHPHGGSY